MVKGFGGLKIPLSESASGAQPEITNFVAMLSNQMASTRAASFFKTPAYVSGASTAPASKTASISACPSSKMVNSSLK